MARKYNPIENLEKEKEERKEKITKEKDENFLEKVLSNAGSEFENYKKGYKTFSLKNPDYCDSIKDKILSDIVNKITDKYKCTLISLSMSEGDEPFSRKTYLFTFKKVRGN